MARGRRRVPNRRVLARAGDETRPLGSSVQQAVLKSDGRWIVRPMSGAATGKDYRCPGCQQVITVGTPHQVVWPAEPSLTNTGGLEERRHWHTACWQRRR